MKHSNQENIRVTLLTVGEYPRINGLHASQVIPFAEYLVSKGIPCEWIAFYPFEIWIKYKIKNPSNLSELFEFTSRKGIVLKAASYPINTGLILSYVFRDFLVLHAGRKLAKMLSSSTKKERHIVHCRSYFAAAVALVARNINNNIHVSFDMRSMLPPEPPLMFPRIGHMLYGGLKIWESHLLANCDYSFLQAKNGIALLTQEGHRRLPMYMPVMGFDSSAEELNRTQDNTKPTFAYVGSFGPWHSPIILDKVFKTLSDHMPDSRFKLLGSSRIAFSMPVQMGVLPNDEVKSALQDLWAMVVPGPENAEDFFNTLQLHANLFSTKAAEALSLGVPLIVNHRITELANYVREHGCGLIFSVEKGKIHFHGIETSELCNPQMWHNLRKAAVLCAPTFQRSHIFENYLRVWFTQNDAGVSFNFNK